ncbi:MAG: hypothetical protein HFJ10_05310 [Lachnospiraceae bacterium]|jgi:hypothetical protein|nr:hypothetical protein [Lachnospiraceae bacterium]
MSKSRLFNDTPYLPFAAHDTQQDTSLEIPDGDIRTLRELTHTYAEIAYLPEQKDRMNRWKAINDLKGGRPVLWANEVCWHEMNVEDELTMRCQSELGLRLENMMRKTIYQWRHFAGDMVVEPVIDAPYIIQNTGFGIEAVADIAETNSESTIASRHFHNQIHCMEDLEKIKTAVIQVDHKRTKEFLECYQMIFDGILPVRTKGCSGFWYAPWDDIVLWMGAQDVLTMLYDDPDLMHALIERLTNAYDAALNQFAELGLLASNNCNVRIGSGGYGYTGELSEDKGLFTPTEQMWGSATPQIFGSVSPAMHREFGVNYEMKWLKRFGLNYYGCCEPLHNRTNILEDIPNLRKISVSPWADVSVAAEHMRGKYAVSLKPSSAYLAYDSFPESLVREELETKFKALQGCCTEVIIKDISTVRNEPERLWRWMEIAMETAAKYE